MKHTDLFVVSMFCEHMFVDAFTLPTPEVDELPFAAEGSILHADLDSFYASVEQRDDPSLRRRPIAVGGGIILAASYEAKAYGVRTAMPSREAKTLCPDLIEVPARFSAYVEASRAVFDIFRDITPEVEGISIDEAFLDVGGLRRLVGPPSMIARTVRRRVREEVGLPISVGVARTKYLAKVASAVSKPDGLLVVPLDAEADFLHPLPIERLWGVGKVTSVKLHDIGIRTVGELAQLEPAVLNGIVGQASGRHLFALAHLRDPRRVETGKRRHSIGSQRAIGRAPRTGEELQSMLGGLVERVARRMRAADRVGSTVILRLRFRDSSRVTRSRTLPQATSVTRTLADTALELLDAAMPLIADKGCTLIGVSITGLSDAKSVQLALPFDGNRDDGLDKALDNVRDRFGSAAVGRGALLRHGEGLSVPMLPD